MDHFHFCLGGASSAKIIQVQEFRERWGGKKTQQKREEDKNQYMNPRLRAMENLRDLFNPKFQEGHARPKGLDGQRIYICLHSKGKCV